MQEIPKEDWKIKMEKKEKANLKNGILIFIIGIIAVIALVILVIHSSQTKPIQNINKYNSQLDKSQEIASFIQQKVNTGGYNGCRARSVGSQLVQVDLKFPAGTDRLTVETNTSGVADRFAQIGRLASIIHYAGYSGSLKVCEYQYDMFDGSVKKIE